MSVCDEWIEKIEGILPEECCTDDLVRVGIYTSPHSASCARKVGDTPPFFKLGKRVMYPRDGVIQWLKEKKHENGDKNCKTPIQGKNKTICKQSGMANCCRA